MIKGKDYWNTPWGRLILQSEHVRHEEPRYYGEWHASATPHGAPSLPDDTRHKRDAVRALRAWVSAAWGVKDESFPSLIGEIYALELENAPAGAPIGVWTGRLERILQHDSRGYADGTREFLLMGRMDPIFIHPEANELQYKLVNFKRLTLV